MSIKDKNGVELPDEETKTILDEIAKEDVDDQKSDKDDDQEPKPAEGDDSKKSEDKGTEDKKDDKKSDDDDDEGKKKDDEDLEFNKEARTISLTKHLQTKRKLKAEIDVLRAQIAQGDGGQKSEQKIDATLDGLADKYNLSKEFLTEFAQTLKKGLVPEDQLKKLESFQKMAESDMQERVFAKDVEKNVMPLIKTEYPEATPKQVQEIVEVLKGLKFSKEYLKTPLSLIYKGMDSFRGLVKSAHKTAEGSKPSGKKEEKPDFEAAKNDPAIIEKMTDAEFDEYSKYLEDQHQPRIKRKGKIVS